MNEHRPLLILDLDETLIYGSEREGLCKCDFRVDQFYVHKRPHLHEFLCGVADRYILAVWSSASSAYVELISRQIIPPGIQWAFVWNRERCTVSRNPETLEVEYAKDLKKVKRKGYDLARVLIVDDTHHKVARHYGNAIYIQPFEGDPSDEELPLLQAYLIGIADSNNFRQIEKRGWRNRTSISNAKRNESIATRPRGHPLDDM
jgi:TFIIF-interacting CTD phosphatase-like protein